MSSDGRAFRVACGICERVCDERNLVKHPNGGPDICPSCAEVISEPLAKQEAFSAPASHKEDSEIRSFIRAATITALPMQLMAGFCWLTSLLSLLGTLLSARLYEESLKMVVIGLIMATLIALVGILLWCAATWFIRFSQLLGRITAAVERR